MPSDLHNVLLIGLDAADPALLETWADSGRLPAIQALRRQGLCGTTQNPVGLYVGAVWPSFFTGVSPARHGRYCYEQLASGTYEVKRFSPGDLKWEPFWPALGRAGRRVAVVDVPKSPYTPNINGIQLLDWGTHDPEPDGEFQTWPPELAQQIVAQYGSDPVGDCNQVGRSVDEISRFCDDLVSRIRGKTDMCLEFLEQEKWDLLLAVFAESHCVGHQLWNLHDPTHPRHDAAIARRVGDPVERVYVALDEAIGRLCAAVGANTTILVLASHGMGAHYDATFLLDEILCRLEKVGPSSARRGAVSTLKWCWKKMPRLFRSPLRTWVERTRSELAGQRGMGQRSLKKALLAPELRRRRCFTIPNNDVYGGIRVNLVGREPEGRVHPGDEFDALFEQLRTDLLEIVNVETGRPLARNLLRVSELYPGGECVDGLPDFFVEWDRDHPIREVSSPKIGTIRREYRGIRTGDHKPQGRIFAVGPTVQPGRLTASVSVMDIAPTVGALLNVPLPNLDGRPIPAVVSGQLAQPAPSSGA